jgi:hypothetical protein
MPHIFGLYLAPEKSLGTRSGVGILAIKNIPDAEYVTSSDVSTELFA